MNDEAITAALEVLENHVRALNARDAEAIAKTLHFPHFRLAGERVKIWETSESYLKDFHTRAGSDWGHTEWGHLKPLQSDANKVHLDVRVDRFDKSGNPLVSFTSLWVVQCIDGVWAAKMRSSFAQDLS